MTRPDDLVVRESEVQWESWSDSAKSEKGPILWKILVSGGNTPSKAMTMGVGEIPPGASLLRHHHSQEEIYYVLSGEGNIEIDDNLHPITTGSAIFIPSNARHRTTNTGAVPLRFTFIFPVDRFEKIEYHFDE